MHIIEIIVEKDRSVKCEEIYGGINGENSVTQLKFIIPKEYKNFYKYLDILKSDGVKTQTVVGDLENEIFYFTLPFSLTKEKEIVIQLVLKLGKKVFMSNMISLYFNDSLNATEVIDDNYQDTIEFIMENKTDLSFSEELSKTVKNKADKLDVYNLDLRVTNQLSEKTDNLEFKDFKEEVLNVLHNKVDKEKGMGLSEENYTIKEKEKLNKLPSEEELNQRINYIDLGVLDEFDIDYLPKVNKVQEIAVSEGVYHIKWAFDEIMGITDYAADGLLFKTMFYGEPALYLYVNGTNYYCKGAQDIWIRANVGNIIDLGEAEITGYNFPLEDFERIMSEKYSQFTRKSGVYQVRWTLTM
ncbi:MAG: hypothetical protein IKZ35_05305, partial [Clostridia bacterium]|nr:hypothetical protein [Clostridia bacterium]